MLRSRRTHLLWPDYLILVLLAVVFLFPLIWMVATSLETNEQALTSPQSFFPTLAQWSNYTQVIIALNFGRELFNSLFMAVSVTLGQVLLASLAGYAFARLHFFGRDWLFLLILATLIIPFEVLFVPLYLMLAAWGDWLNTFKALIIPSLANPFAIFVFRQFFLTIPKELDEAARVEGAGFYRVFWSLMLPLAGPPTVTVFILTFLAEWSDLLKPLVFTSSADMYTLQQGLAITLNRGATLMPNIPLLLAGVTLTSLFPLLFFLIAQRYFMQSISSTGLKG